MGYVLGAGGEVRFLAPLETTELGQDLRFVVMHQSRLKGVAAGKLIFHRSAPKGNEKKPLVAVAPFVRSGGDGYLLTVNTRTVLSIVIRES